LSNQLARAGFEVFCIKGSGATYPGPGEQCHLSLFDTNDDLLELLEQTSAAHEISAVFHVAALCDYKVKRVEDDQGRSETSNMNKISIQCVQSSVTITTEGKTRTNGLAGRLERLIAAVCLHGILKKELDLSAALTEPTFVNAQN